MGHNPVMHGRIWQILERKSRSPGYLTTVQVNIRIRNGCSIDIKAKQEVGHFVVVGQS